MSWKDEPKEWEKKLHEYGTVCDKLAVAIPEMNYLERIERRMFSLTFREAQGNIEERKAAFYGSKEYLELCQERRGSEESVNKLRAKKDVLAVWFDLYRTDESTDAKR